MNARSLQLLLTANGFPTGPADGIVGPKTEAAVRRFQNAYNGADPWLAIDGIPGPKTSAALEELPHLSAHFTVAELKSKGNGNCYVDRRLLAALEILRDHIGAPIPIISAYRDPAHNRAQGGATFSMHVEGLAADVPHVCGWEDARELRLFSGIGDKRGKLAHVDLRHVSPNNKTPLATPERPSRWHY